jgi:VWFA-related protein
MTARSVRLAVIAVGVCAGAVTYAQQSRQRPPVFRTNTELVEIDVVVIDKDGNRVHGLTRDDFILRDRATPQPIETFTEVQEITKRTVDAPKFPPNVRTDVASNTSAEAGRLVVLVLDDLHVWQGRTDTVREIARQIVTDIGPESSMALLQTGGDHSTEVTNDRSRLLESIERFKGRRPVRRPLPACDPGPTRRNQETPDVFASGCDIQNLNANRSLYKSLQDAAGILGGSDRRRKAFILVSEHIAKDITGLFDGGEQIPKDLPDSSAYYGGDPGGIGPPPPVASHDYALLDMMNAMRRGNVATYSIDPRGEVTSQELALECFPGPPDDPCTQPFRWDSWIRQAQQGLHVVSEETGGFAVTDTDDFTSGIATIIGDLDNYYLLGFYATDLDTKGYRPIHVEVKGRPELTLRYRRGYEIRADDATDRRAAARDPLTVLVDNALPASGLPMRLHAIPMPSSGNRSRVAVSLELSVPRALLAQSDSDQLLDGIRYGVYAIDLKGAKVREHIGAGAQVALRPRPGLAEPPDAVTYQIALELELQAGRYQLRASAISEKLGAGGSVYLSLDVPDFSKADLELTELLLAFADGPRVPVARDRREIPPPATTRAPARGGQTLPPAAQRAINASAAAVAQRREAPSLLPFEPALDRTFSRRDVVRLYFKAVQRDRRPVLATISALTPEGDTVVTSDRDLPESGDLDINLPLSQLAPGGYRLQVVVSNGRTTATRDVGFQIK